MNDEKYAVRVESGQFFKGFDGQYIHVTDTPSFADFLSYDAAATWVARLRKSGYPQSVVTDLAGTVMTYDLLREHIQAAEEKAQDNLPTTRDELDRIPTSEVRKRYRTDAAFAQRVDELEAQPRQPSKRRAQ